MTWWVSLSAGGEAKWSLALSQDFEERRVIQNNQEEFRICKEFV